ncbi:MAG: hypothetical protein RL742_1276 [Bacteroidota bacterium]|jgi:hypothetical protein
MATQQPDGYNGGNGASMGKQLLMLALMVGLGIVAYQTFFADGGFSNPFGGGKEMRLTYMPSDFKPTLDEEATLRILSSPEQYRREFDDLVYNFNLSLLYHVANRMGLPDSLRRQLEPAYQKHHEYLKDLYYADFVALKDTTGSMYETWYNDNANQAVQVFNEVAGKYTCFFVTQILATLIKTDGGKLLAKGKKVDTPCGIAIQEGLRPMIERLQKKAAIYDFSASRGFLKERVRKGIAELATYELRSRLGIDRTLQYKIFGFSVSETNIQVEAISVIKAGFKLDQYFDITMNPNKKIVYVTLPEPQIVSHEVYPRVDKLDVGFLSGIDKEEMNTNFNELRRQFRQDALEQEQILDKARMRADSVMQLLLGPTVKGMGRNYTLEVRYRGMPEVMDADELRRRGLNGEGAPEMNAGERPRPLPQ